MAFATNPAAFGMGGSKPATGSLFGAPQQQQQPSTSTSNQPTSNLFGQPQQQPSGGLFGQTSQQQPSGGLFGQSSQQQQPSGGLFGQTTQQQPSGGLFGQSSQQQQPSGGLFGQTTQQQPAGGLFGQSTQQQQPSGGLFGQSTQQQQPSGGLFGQSTQQQQPSGGLFGQATQQQQPSGGGLFGQSTQQQPSGGLFGQSTQQQQPSGGLFGQSTQQQQQQGAFGTSSLFGGNTQSNAGAFGSSTQPQQQTASGLFGASSTNPQPAGAFGGGSLFGNKSQQPLQQQPQGFIGSTQSSGPPPFTKSTKFNDLPDDVKRVLEQIDTHIQGCVQISKDLHQRKLGEEPVKGQELIRNIHKDLVNTSSMIRDDHLTTNNLKAKVDQAVEDTIVATRIIDEFRNPQGGGNYRKDHAAFPLEYFNRVTEQMKERLTWYRSTIEQIERKLTTTGHSQSPQGISTTLQAQHASFLALANKTAAVDAELQKIKVLYTQLWRAKTGSVRDPFSDLDVDDEERSGDFGLSGLNFR